MQPHVLSVIRAHLQIVRIVVLTNMVPVVHFFTRAQGAAEFRFNNHDVFEDVAFRIGPGVRRHDVVLPVKREAGIAPGPGSFKRARTSKRSNCNSRRARPSPRG
jgi:hypothetical protein